MNNLSVIILSKTASNLVPCMKAVQRHEPQARIVVIDDGLDLAVLPLHPYIRVDMIGESSSFLPGIKPFVYARNCNLGVVEAGDNDVILLNDDALLQTPGGFTAMQEAARDNPQFGLIGAVTNVVGNTNQMPQGIGLREEPRMVCFVCVFIPRGTIERVGLLDEEFIGYGFDDDSYCLRVRRAGLKIGIYDGCFVDHGSLKSTFRGNPHAPADLRQNQAIFKQKYGADHWAL